VLKERYGPKTQLKLISAQRGLLSRFSPFGSRISSDIAASAADGFIDAAQERALWARFGL
jgi:hypothetical protein